MGGAKKRRDNDDVVAVAVVFLANLADVVVVVVFGWCISLALSLRGILLWACSSKICFRASGHGQRERERSAHTGCEFIRSRSVAIPEARRGGEREAIVQSNKMQQQ